MSTAGVLFLLRGKSEKNLVLELTQRFQAKDWTLLFSPSFNFFIFNSLIVNWCDLNTSCEILPLLCPLVLHGCEENDLSEGNHLAEDEPQVDHLDVRGGGQALHLADEDGGHHQHGGQVHA